MKAKSTIGHPLVPPLWLVSDEQQKKNPPSVLLHCVTPPLEYCVSETFAVGLLALPDQLQSRKTLLLKTTNIRGSNPSQDDDDHRCLFNDAETHGEVVTFVLRDEDKKSWSINLLVLHIL